MNNPYWIVYLVCNIPEVLPHERCTITGIDINEKVFNFVLLQTRQ